jgi:hypothetical protein
MNMKNLQRAVLVLGSLLTVSWNVYGDAEQSQGTVAPTRAPQGPQFSEETA